MRPGNRKQPTRAKSSESQYSIMEFMREFPDDETCLTWLWENRYSPAGKNAVCPKCEELRAFERYHTKQQRQSWTCTACGHHIHPTAGTIFHKSSTSLHLWFYAIYLMTSTRCGISAKQLEREIGVTYKTAWRMANLIRTKLMGDEGKPLSGDVEADEMYHGGYRKGRRGRGAAGKTPVFGMVQRQGHVVAMTVPNVRAKTLQTKMVERILPSSSIFTDELSVYDGIDYMNENMGYRHQRIKHTERVYVSGDIHTNTIEGFWSLVKRGIGGVYHSVSAKHLQGYLNEYAWRYNQRNERRSMFRTLLLRTVGS
ncbi:MAG: IS1595 family transposase [Acidobacteria bacterium]|nr:IS1595 family transposase [Acidobacteriota bacterium]